MKKKEFSNIENKLKQMKKAERKAQVGLGLFAMLVIFMTIYCIISHGIDTDTYFILNNGRYILEHGFPTTNPFTIHKNLPIILSQPMTAILEYIIYQHFRHIGLFIWTFSWTMILFFSLYKWNKELNRHGCYFLTLVMSFSSFFLLTAYFTNRPGLLTICFLVWELMILDKYDRIEDKKILLGLPLIGLLSINFHMSVYPVIFLPILAHFAWNILEWGIKHIFTLIGQKNIPQMDLFTPNHQSDYWIGIAALGMGLAGLFNPYGLQGMLYFFKSIGVATEYNFIQELQRPMLCSSNVIVIGITSAIIIKYLIRNKQGYRISSRHFFLWLGGFLTYLGAIRNFWMYIIFSLPLLMDACKMNEDSLRNLKNVFIQLHQKIRWVGILILVNGIFLWTAISGYREKWTETYDTYATPYLAVTYLDSQEINPEQIKLYTGFNNGAYMELYGYKTYIDARPELYETDEQPIYTESVDIAIGKSNPELFIQKYDFDYLIVNDSDSYMEASLRYALERNPDYICVLKGKNYDLYKKN